jgi:hypothetical protein
MLSKKWLLFKPQLLIRLIAGSAGKRRLAMPF